MEITNFHPWYNLKYDFSTYTKNITQNDNMKISCCIVIRIQVRILKKKYVHTSMNVEAKKKVEAYVSIGVNLCPQLI